MSTIEQEADGSTTEYFEVSVAGDQVERLMREVFTDHWAHVVVGPIIEGSAWEIRFTSRPKVTMLDGYLTVDPGAWHFHLCVNDHRAAATPELARIRRVARAAFFRSDGGSHAPGSWGLRLWNGRSEQMVTVYFPNPHFDDKWNRLAEPRWEKSALWEDLRRRYAE